MRRTLTPSTGSFDRTNTFRVALPRSQYAGFRCSLQRDYKVAGDGILWFMQHAGCISAHYSTEEIAERERLNREEPIRHGDVVTVNGRDYRVRVLGDFSDMAILDPVA